MQIATDAAVKQAVTSELHTLDNDSLYARIQAMVPRWKKCLNSSTDHVETWCVTSAMQVACVYRSADEALSIAVFVTLSYET